MCYNEIVWDAIWMCVYVYVYHHMKLIYICKEYEQRLCKLLINNNCHTFDQKENTNLFAITTIYLY